MPTGIIHTVAKQAFSSLYETPTQNHIPLF